MARQALPIRTLPLLLVLVVALPAGALATSSTLLHGHGMPAMRAGDALAQPTPLANDLVYHGGPVLPAPVVYVTYWGWGLVGDPNHEAPYLEAFFNGIGGSGWANIQTQYYYGASHSSFITNPTGQLGGVWYDDSLSPPPVAGAGAVAPPTSGLYIETEAAKAAQHFGYSPNALYLIALPHGDGTDYAGGYCAYHYDTTDGRGHTIAFTDIPYLPDYPNTVLSCGANAVNSGAAGRLDGVSIVAGHEYAEAVTDAAPNTGWSASDGENGDKCAWQTSGAGKMQDLVLPTGTFAVQGLWSNAAHGCVITYP